MFFGRNARRRLNWCCGGGLEARRTDLSLSATKVVFPPVARTGHLWFPSGACRSSSFSLIAGDHCRSSGSCSLRGLGDTGSAIAARMPGFVVENLAVRCAWRRSGHFRLHLPNLLSSAHLRCSKTASLRAMAVTSRSWPLVRINRVPNDIVCDLAMVFITKALAVA